MAYPHGWDRLGPRRLEYHGRRKWWITFWKRDTWQPRRPRFHAGPMDVLDFWLPYRRVTLRRWRHGRPATRLGVEP